MNTTAAQKKQDKQNAINALRTKLEPNKTRRDRTGSEIVCITRSVSRSGMSRRVTCLISHQGYVENITHLVAAALGLHRNEAGVLVKGAGMDMHFHLVYNLGHAVFNDGYALNYRTI